MEILGALENICLWTPFVSTERGRGEGWLGFGSRQAYEQCSEGGVILLSGHGGLMMVELSISWLACCYYGYLDHKVLISVVTRCLT